MGEERSCDHCGEPFRVNPRSGERHRYCARDECQRVRRRVAQRARRGRRGEGAEAPRPSAAWRMLRAAYMRDYRRSHPDYRERERVAAGRRRLAAAGAGPGVVTEAGLTREPAKVYLVVGPGPGTRLHVVTATGRAATIRAQTASAAS